MVKRAPDGRVPDGRAGIDAALVRRLIRAQFPRWGGLAVEPVAVDGWDNRTYRLGSDKTVRLPTAAGYVPAVAKENTWLPRLAPALPLAVPPVLGLGEPGEGYPYPWSVRGWLDGETVAAGRVADLTALALDLADFLRALRRCDTQGAPAAGEHSWWRGASPAHYDEETRRCLAALREEVDTGRARAVWEAALATRWEGEPVWFHGDVAPGNLLLTGGRLGAVIDFGTSGVGDPACDLVIAWGLFSAESRTAFRDALGLDAGTWARARGWALWKSLLVLSQIRDTDPEQAAAHRRIIADVLDDVLDDHARSSPAR
ncbi:aminoglycoside phosphotransferase family protein [Streptomyces sp. NPDC007088]|uniref:aminoglycoside phosphotransferase family protein n=1 Tax=Streptomyces sp. NPDC007088 TaxID=3364773 RepID=UPI0036B743EF